jgi:4'-phosphopantetheinyl transferase
MNHIHVWSAHYTDLERHFRILSDSISRQEQETACTFRKSADAKKYIIRRGIVRSVLAWYTRCTPEKLVFIIGKNGKPELSPDASAGVSFNLSHTEEKVFIGVTKKHRIGVDIVSMDPSYHYRDAAEYLFTPAEKAFLVKTEPSQRYQVFFRIWAAKEAVIKAAGGTMTRMKTIDLSDIIEDMLVNPEYSMNCLAARPPYFLWQFTCGPGYLGAIAVDAE